MRNAVPLAPLPPPPAETGRHRAWPMREMMNAIFFERAAAARGACCRDALSAAPGGLIAWFTRFRDDRTRERLNHLLVMRDRERVRREASPSAAVIGSQSVKTTEAGGPRGGMTQARKSTAASVTSRTIRMAGG